MLFTHTYHIIGLDGGNGRKGHAHEGTDGNCHKDGALVPRHAVHEIIDHPQREAQNNHVPFADGFHEPFEQNTLLDKIEKQQQQRMRIERKCILCKGTVCCVFFSLLNSTQPPLTPVSSFFSYTYIFCTLLTCAKMPKIPKMRNILATSESPNPTRSSR